MKYVTLKSLFRQFDLILYLCVVCIFYNLLNIVISMNITAVKRSPVQSDIVEDCTKL